MSISYKISKTGFLTKHKMQKVTLSCPFIIIKTRSWKRRCCCLKLFSSKWGTELLHWKARQERDTNFTSQEVFGNWLMHLMDGARSKVVTHMSSALLNFSVMRAPPLQPPYEQTLHCVCSTAIFAARLWPLCHEFMRIFSSWDTPFVFCPLNI